MPVRVVVKQELDLTQFIVEGEFAFEAQMETLRAFYEGEYTHNVLWDLRTYTGERISSRQLQRMVTYFVDHTDKRAGGKTAMVVQNDLDYGLARMGSAIAEVSQYRCEFAVFRTCEDAMDWLAGAPGTRKPPSLFQ